MPTKNDDKQQDPIARNGNLADLLMGEFQDSHIVKITRIPAPTDPPNPDGPKEGAWEIEIV